MNTNSHCKGSLRSPTQRIEPERAAMRYTSAIVLLVALVRAEAAEPVARLGSPQLRHPGKYILALAFSPDAKLLASGGEGHVVVLWDVATGREVKRFRTADRTPYVSSRSSHGSDTVSSPAAGFSPDGKL